MKESRQKTTFLFIILLALSFAVIPLSAKGLSAQQKVNTGVDLWIQVYGYVQILTTRDGSTLIGRIVEIRDNDVRFMTDWGEVTIPLGSITRIQEMERALARKTKYQFTNPNTTRLFFAPTGRTLRKGTGYFSNYYVLFPGIAYAITDNLSIGGGMSIIPWIDLDEQLFYLTPKLGLKTAKNLHLSAGALLIRVNDFDDGDDLKLVGAIYGVGTLGTLDESITAGLGYGFEGSDFADKPMIMVGGELRASNRTAFVTENWLFPGADKPLVSYGVRFFGEKISVDLAFINVVSEDAIFPGIPYIDFVYNF